MALTKRGLDELVTDYKAWHDEMIAHMGQHAHDQDTLDTCDEAIALFEKLQSLNKDCHPNEAINIDLELDDYESDGPRSH